MDSDNQTSLENEHSAVLFAHLAQLSKSRTGIQQIYDENFAGSVLGVEWLLVGDVGVEHMQHGLTGAPTASLDALFAVAELAHPLFESLVAAAIERADSGATPTFKRAPLKGRERAAEKAHTEYAEKTAPATAWIFDVCRGSVICSTEQQLVSLYRALDADPDFTIVRTQNRFASPAFNGFRDLLLNVAVVVVAPETGRSVSHICELQLHHAAIKLSDDILKSHTTYEYFRSFLVGSKDAVAARLGMLVRLPVGDFSNLSSLVEHMFSHHADDAVLLGRLLAERTLATTVRVRISELHATDDEAGLTPHFAAVLDRLATSLQAQGKFVDAERLSRRALAIREKKQRGCHPDVATSLKGLAQSLQAQGKDVEAEPLLRRAIAIREKQHRPENVPRLMSLDERAESLLRLLAAHKNLQVVKRKRAAALARRQKSDVCVLS